METIIKSLIEKGEELSNRPFVPIKFTKEPEVDVIINDIENFPHQFVLSCIMDRKIIAERAWKIPYIISKKINDFNFVGLLKFTENELITMFQENGLHKYNQIMGRCFYKAIQHIHNEYNNDAYNIWANNPKSATIVKRFLRFDGVGIKIATMATNILARDFKIPMQDKICIDISPDVQVKRVFTRLGLIDKNSSNEELIFCARELNPIYPGIFDLSVWEIGRQWCKPTNPYCTTCPLTKNCQKIID